MRKVLIVEDEESNFELLKAFLRKREIDISWAKTGIQAIELCDSQDFHLVLLDIKMPEMNGYKIFEILRSKGMKFPIIAQTAYARKEDEEKILSIGFDGYISKPIDQSKFNSIINKYIP